jgi:hypothetical protein
MFDDSDLNQNAINGKILLNGTPINLSGSESSLNFATSNLDFFQVFNENFNTIISVLFLNWLMLLFGYLGEINIIPTLLGKIATFHNDIYHRDIGTPESLAAAEREFPEIYRAFKRKGSEQ